MHYLLLIKKYESILRKSGVNRIVGEFSGSGDSGEIDYVDVYNKKGESIHTELKAILIDFDTTKNYFQNGEMIEEKITLQLSLFDLCNEILDAYSMSSGTNWWDSEGGSGFLNIDFESDEVNIEADTSYNIIESVSTDYTQSTLNDLLNEQF